MHLAYLLQIIFAIFYYATAPFEISAVIYLGLTLNYVPLLMMWLQSHNTTIEGTAHFRLYRRIFTSSLLGLGLLLNITDGGLSLSPIQGLANDAEVLFSGILLGMLWRQDLIELENKLKKLTQQKARD